MFIGKDFYDHQTGEKKISYKYFFSSFPNMSELFLSVVAPLETSVLEEELLIWHGTLLKRDGAKFFVITEQAGTGSWAHPVLSFTE